MKPYVSYADCYPDAKSGFVDSTEWKPLDVVIPTEVANLFSSEELESLREVLSFDPRPQYHDDASRVYGMPFDRYDVRFQVSNGTVQVVNVVPVSVMDKR